MPVKAPQIEYQSPNETRIYSVSFSGKLDTGELLSGTPTVTENASPNILTITNKAVNTAALTIGGISTAIGEAVQFKVVGANIVAGTKYTLLITCGTDAGQTVDGEIEFVGI